MKIEYLIKRLTYYNQLDYLLVLVFLKININNELI